MSEYIQIAKVADIPDQTGRCVLVQGRRIALFNLGGSFFAMADACTHRGGPLSDGHVEDDEVICPWHAARFNIRTGQATEWPASEAVQTFPVRVAGEAVEIALPG